MEEMLKLEYRVSGQDVVLYERRPHWNKKEEWLETPAAKLKFVRTAGEWRLFWMRADLKWHRYDPFPASKQLGDLVDEISRDPCACFFG